MMRGFDEERFATVLEEFDEGARAAVTLAQEEAARLGHGQAGTGHLLLALMRDGEGTAARALGSLDIAFGQARERIEDASGRGEEGTLDRGPFTPRLARVVELAPREAARAGHERVGTGHLLLGLVREANSVAVRALSALGASPADVRREVIRQLRNPPKRSGREETPRRPARPEPSGTASSASLPHDRFTNSGRRVVLLAADEAGGLGRSHVEPEHLLLGVLRERGRAAVGALEALGADVDPERAREMVVRAMDGSDAREEDRRPSTPLERPLATQTTDTLVLALDVARTLGHNYAGAEHILLALAARWDGITARVLHQLGAGPGGIRREVVRALGAAFRGRVKGLVVRARCGVTAEERAEPQPLRVDLDYRYVATKSEDLAATVDYAALIEDVASTIEGEEFRLLEYKARMVGEHVLRMFPQVEEVTVSLTKPNASVEREVAGISVQTTVGR